MRIKSLFATLGVVVLLSSSLVTAQSQEDEIVQRYLDRVSKKHARKLTYLSGHFELNRINRNNDYNKFATNVSANLDGGSIPWLSQAKSFGLNLGVVFNQRFAWSLGGEYWLKLGQNLTGDYYYTPLGAPITDPKSEVQVYGFSTGLQYYLFNHPQLSGELNNFAVRVGGTVGYYQVSWKLWDEYQNLNLSTGVSAGTNTTFKDNAPGFAVNLGLDYPLNFHGMVLGLDMSYLYLNFDKVAWYNTQNEEVVATYNNSPDSRVDLNLSGVKGRIELKRFFSW